MLLLDFDIFFRLIKKLHKSCTREQRAFSVLFFDSQNLEFLSGKNVIWSNLPEPPEDADLSVSATLILEMKHLLDIMAPFLSIQGFLWYILINFNILFSCSFKTQQNVFGTLLACTSSAADEDPAEAASLCRPSLGDRSGVCPLELVDSSCDGSSFSFSRCFVSGRCLKWKQLNPLDSMNWEK